MGLTIAIETSSPLGVARVGGIRYGASDGVRPGWARPEEIRRERERMITEQAAKAIQAARAEEEAIAAAKTPEAIARRKALGPRIGDKITYVCFDGATGMIRPYGATVIGSGNDPKDPTAVKLRYHDGVNSSEPPCVPYGSGQNHTWCWEDETPAARRPLHLEMEPKAPCPVCAATTMICEMGTISFSSARHGSSPPRLCGSCVSALQAIVTGGPNTSVIRNALREFAETFDAAG
jgi:hypothetical protein